MAKRKRKNINAVSRPTHPGRAVYTAIIGAKVSVGEIATVIGITRQKLVDILKGQARLTPRVAFLLAEFFTWDRALRWLIMQTKCDMYLSAVKERRARRMLLDDDPSELDGEAWRETVSQAWENVGKDDYRDEADYPIEIDEENDVTMKEELSND